MICMIKCVLIIHMHLQQIFYVYTYRLNSVKLAACLTPAEWQPQTTCHPAELVRGMTHCLLLCNVNATNYEYDE